MQATAELVRGGVRPAAHRPTPPAGEYLSFTLGAEDYVIDILKVQEIRSYERPTRIVNAPAFIKGVVNLRGVIVPLADLRLKFGLADAGESDLTVVIVLNVGRRVVGIVVDSVSDVVCLSREDIKPAPQTGHGAQAAFIDGIGCLDDRMLIMLDIDALLRSDEIGLLPN